MIARLFNRLFTARWRADRVDGATATRWETGYFTRDRTDLPYPRRVLRAVPGPVAERVTNTVTVPDEVARAHPLHAVIAGTLRWAGGRAPADRIWGRWYGADHDAGAEGNLWAGDPDDVADLIVRAIAQAPPTEATAAAWARLRAES